MFKEGKNMAGMVEDHSPFASYHCILMAPKDASIELLRSKEYSLRFTGLSDKK